MGNHKKFVKFENKIVFIGFGCVGQGVLPLLLRHIDISPSQIHIITADTTGQIQAEKAHVSFSICPLTPKNFQQVLDENLASGDYLLNLSINVSSLALIEYCYQHDLLYLDACLEPWLGGYTDTTLSLSARSNYHAREQSLSLRKRLGGGPTAVLCHGANPGLVSHFTKQALVNIARDTGIDFVLPQTREAWAALSRKLNIKVIQCAERDTQTARPFKLVNEFVNTWSIDGFIGEGLQPAELGWGSHEKTEPPDASRHGYGCDAAIYLNNPGTRTLVRSWNPLTGPYQGFLITHAESISIADYFTVKTNHELRYRPTVYYAYHPSDATVLSIHELSGRNFKEQDHARLLMNDIESGADALGMALMGHAKGFYWYGSILSIEEARDLAPYNNATSLQVASGILGGMVWAIENPEAGIIEPEEMDFKRVLQVASPYLGDITGQYSNWTPLRNNLALYEDHLDTTDPWQFKNYRVV
ncbi:MAG: saccharopine dehydrogenase C-terminal domain-containing protein [Nitrosomonas sp.]|nr:saccharopine dehydrogenase C-terminal domain-containing protein [Nitrosomonas sp.]